MAIQQRAVLSVITFLGFVVVYILRVNLSVAMVAMTHGGNSSSDDGGRGRYANDSYEVCPPDGAGNASSVAKKGEFDWDQQTQGLVLGSFFWGYILTQVPGGLAAERFGAKWVLGVGVLWTAGLTLLTPLAARWSVAALVCLRVLEGVGEGVTFPAMNALLSQWAPPWERTTMAVFVISGSYMGTVVGLPLSGYLCASDFLGGWPSVFYVFGAVGVAWFLLWSLLAYSSPAQHPWISRKELTYIQDSLQLQIGDVVSGRGAGRSRAPLKPPLRAMLTSPPVLSMMSMHIAYNWLFYTLLTCLPTFLADVLSTPLTEDGFASALPYLALWAVANVAAVLSDLVRRRSWLSVTALRKLGVACGAVAGSVGVTAVGHLGCDRGAAVAVLTAAVGVSGLVVAGFGPNQLDLAPRFAGTLLGLSNTLATIPGMVAPVVVGAITNHASIRTNWQKVFYLSAGIVMTGCLCYLAFGSGRVQPWAVAKEEGEEREADREERDESSPALERRPLLRDARAGDDHAVRVQADS